MRSKNLLPKDGEVFYFPNFIKEPLSCFDSLHQSLNWTYDEVIIFGKHIITKRLSCWYGDQQKIYKYAGIAREPIAWNNDLLEIKQLLLPFAAFNSCLGNLYPSGNESMGWHADNEKELGNNPIIASISLGASRKFAFKHNITKEKVEIVLEPGSLLLMQGATQHCWKHSLPKTTKVLEPRINLTFRMLY